MAHAGAGAGAGAGAVAGAVKGASEKIHRNRTVGPKAQPAHMKESAPPSHPHRNLQKRHPGPLPLPLPLAPPRFVSSYGAGRYTRPKAPKLAGASAQGGADDTPEHPRGTPKPGPAGMLGGNYTSPQGPPAEMCPKFMVQVRWATHRQTRQRHIAGFCFSPLAYGYFVLRLGASPCPVCRGL